MEAFVQYRTVRAIEAAAQQECGLAGLGAGVALGNKLVQNVQQVTDTNTPAKSRAEQLRELKGLLDEGILTQDEFDMEKKRVLES